MSVLTLPVPWKDINEVGLKGVFEVHSSDLRRQKVKGSRVCELMAILNEKLKALPQHRSHICIVKSLRLHGCRVSDDRLLESLIPDLESSTPRLVVAVQARPKTTKSKGLVVFVKTLTGKSVTVVSTSDDTVDCVKSQIRVQAHVPVDDQRIMYGSKQLEDNRKLWYYKIKNNSSLYLVARLRGGITEGSASRSFVNVSNGLKLVERKLSHTAPDWRGCTKGLKCGRLL
ncbi:unnamed protein product [Peronospora destructor]|uniref:Ubiquitin-like domain-containing protein n=1 Tax=Peronospora destructor TaxID=86335 RepID=A0AAV0TLJ9_9STRA|nr:unnamed protein product [Peronospora destructor]